MPTGPAGNTGSLSDLHSRPPRSKTRPTRAIACANCTHVYTEMCTCNPCSHTLCALSRSRDRSLPYSFVRSFTRSLAASRFEISTAVADTRCPRPDRAPAREVPRTPRRSRSRSIDRSGGGVAEVFSTFHLDEARARTCRRVAEDVLSLSADRSIARQVGRSVDRSIDRFAI